MRTAANPRLYDPLPDVPVLRGVECSHCNRVYFPPIGIGCEICGGSEDQLRAKPLEAIGIVHALAEVHQSVGKIEAPFTVAEVALDAGPLIRAMVHPDSDRMQIGQRVAGRWNTIGHNDAGAAVVEPAFATMPAAASHTGDGASA